MLNASVMATSPGLTQDGYESQFGTTHMGYALLTKLLLPLLTRTSNNAYVRVVSVASHGHKYIPNSGFRFGIFGTRAEGLGAYRRCSSWRMFCRRGSLTSCILSLRSLLLILGLCRRSRRTGRRGRHFMSRSWLSLGLSLGTGS